jgi:hypothetical protein
VPALALLLALAPLLAVALAGCGKASFQPSSGEAPSAPSSTATAGAGAVATKNTTRLGGESAAVNAAAVARAIYPGVTATGRPRAVLLIDQGDWPAALAASVLEGRPLHAPLLYSEGIALPSASEQALDALAPTGAAALGGAQALRIGEAAAPANLRVSSLSGHDPAGLAVAIEQLQSRLRGAGPRRVIVTASDAPAALTAPAAGLAALTATPILFVLRNGIPAATRRELLRLGHVSIYAVGPRSVMSDALLGALRRFGTVHRIAAPAAGGSAASNAVAVARFSDGPFGWGAQEAGHGFVFASASRPLDGPAAAGLSASGDFAPLLLLEEPNAIPSSVAEYLSDLQPGYPPSGPVHGVYNHGWLIGGDGTISAATQSTLDAMLEISPRKNSTEPAAPELESQPSTTTTG